LTSARYAIERPRPVQELAGRAVRPRSRVGVGAPRGVVRRGQS
jgi:hypothetical protein